MRTIRKSNEPTSLTEYRAAGGGRNYADYPDKDTLRSYLVNDQRGICCYCLSRIRAEPGAMKIEHWHSQADYDAEQLDYSNLLGACMGNEGRPRKDQHCDTRKGNRAISRNPANPMHRVDEVVRFGVDGRISSGDQVFDNEINDVLNLNWVFLKNNRKAILTAFKEALHIRGTLSRTQLERWLREWNGDSESAELRPFCQVVVYWLRRRLSRR
jgi:uncharacterized protein (TIGR02646 family)